MEHQEQKRLMNLNLHEKIEKSKEVIKDSLKRFPHNELCLAWTGGKDSTTMLWLHRQACKELGLPLPRAMFIDEGYVFDEIWDLVNNIKNFP